MSKEITKTLSEFKSMTGDDIFATLAKGDRILVTRVGDAIFSVVKPVSDKEARVLSAVRGKLGKDDWSDAPDSPDIIYAVSGLVEAVSGMREQLSELSAKRDASGPDASLGADEEKDSHDEPDGLSDAVGHQETHAEPSTEPPSFDEDSRPDANFEIDDDLLSDGEHEFADAVTTDVDARGANLINIPDGTEAAFAIAEAEDLFAESPDDEPNAPHDESDEDDSFDLSDDEVETEQTPGSDDEAMNLAENEPAKSSFDDFLKRVLAFQLEQEMESQGMTKIEMDKKLNTSGSQLDSVLEPQNERETSLETADHPESHAHQNIDDAEETFVIDDADDVSDEAFVATQENAENEISFFDEEEDEKTDDVSDPFALFDDEPVVKSLSKG